MQFLHTVYFGYFNALKTHGGYAPLFGYFISQDLTTKIIYFLLDYFWPLMAMQSFKSCSSKNF